MLLTTETTIRGIRVMTTQLRPMRSFSLMPKILKIVGPAVAPLMTGAVTIAQDVEALYPSFMEAISSLDAADAEGLLERVFESTVVIRDGEKYELVNGQQKIDAAFIGDVRAMLEASWFVLKANYESFFGEDLLKAAASQAAAAETGSPSS